jgi:predicted transcriptional regulator
MAVPGSGCNEACGRALHVEVTADTASRFDFARSLMIAQAPVQTPRWWSPRGTVSRCELTLRNRATARGCLPRRMVVKPTTAVLWRSNKQAALEKPVSGTIAALTAQIVSAYVANNDVPSNALPDLIRQVHQAMAGAASAAPAKPAPAVPVKRSISQDHIVCLEDGKQFKALKRHLKNAHQMTPQQYRERWRLPRSYPMVAPNYAESSAAIAKRGRMAAASERRKQGAGGARQTTADC